MERVAEDQIVPCTVGGQVFDVLGKLQFEGRSLRDLLIEVLNGAGEPALGFDEQPLAATGAPTGETDEYSATFGLGAVATGAVSFRCSVAGFDPELTGSATIDTFVDHGPTISEKLPERDSSHPLEGLLNVEFTVTPTPLVDGDTEAEIAGVKLFVAGVEILDVTEDSASPGTYRASVNFLDGDLFEPAVATQSSRGLVDGDPGRPGAKRGIGAKRRDYDAIGKRK